MINRSLHDYVAKQRASGATDEQIRHSLEANTWKPEDIAKALAEPAALAIPSGQRLLFESLHYYGERFWVLMGLTTIPVFLLFVIRLLTDLITNATAKAFGSSLAVIGLTILISIILFVTAVIGALWSQIALIVVLRDRHEKVGFLEAFRRSSHLIVSFFTTSVLNGLIAFGGLLLFLIPGLVFIVWFAFVPYLVVVENDRGMSALLRSRDLVAGRGGRILARYLYILAVGFLSIFIAQIVVDLVATALQWSSDVTDVVSALIALIIGPFVAVYSYFLFEVVRGLPLVTGPRSAEQVRPWIIGVAISGYALLAIVMIFLFATAGK